MLLSAFPLWDTVSVPVNGHQKGLLPLLPQDQCTTQAV